MVKDGNKKRKRGYKKEENGKEGYKKEEKGKEGYKTEKRWEVTSREMN